MSEEASEQHPLAVRAQELVAKLESLDSIEAPHQETVVRAKAALDAAQVTIEGSNPLLISSKAEAALKDSFDDLETAIPAFTDDATTATPDDFKSAVEDILYRLVDFPVVVQPESLETIRAGLSGFREFAEKETETLAGAAATLRQQLDDLREVIQQGDEEAKTKLDGITQTVSELSAAVEVQKEELRTAISSQADLFSTEQKERQSSFKTFLDQVQAEHKGIQDNVIKKGEDSVADVLKRAEAIVEKIDARHKEVVNTAEAVGLTATISGFVGYADQQKRAADWWRRGAVAALLGIVVLGFITLLIAEGGDLDVQLSLLKGSIATALAFLAGYAGKQSGHHRREERRSRRLGLEIHAFDPYIANLPDNRQMALKEFMALRAFGHLDDEEAGEDRWGEHQPSAQKVLDLLRRVDTDRS